MKRKLDSKICETDLLQRLCMRDGLHLSGEGAALLWLI